MSAQLLDAGSGFHLWSETYERQLSDVFAVQEEISNSIAAILKLRLTPLPPRPAVMLEAYQHWLKGRYY